uniref:Uncharacterized protein n=1 Tax=Populus alba TaxID=43335 RepID=A0A4U5LSS8_POPAL|nr:hypothetical protein D5086_0000326670 [Populus alba]
MQRVLLVCFCCVTIFAIEELYGARSGGTIVTIAEVLAVLSEDILLLLGLWLDCWNCMASSQLGMLLYAAAVSYSCWNGLGLMRFTMGEGWFVLLVTPMTSF